MEKKGSILVKVWGVIVLMALPFIVIYNTYNDNRKNKLFYTSKINSKIIKIRWHWSGRAHRYISEDGIPITLYYPKELMIGDSVSKRNNTDSFQAFRLNSLDSNYYPLELKK